MADIPELARLSTKGLLRVYKDVLLQLERREILTTKDSPIGGHGA
jgi:hypothetical protein